MESKTLSPGKIEITIDKFPIHVEKTRNKYKENKFAKVNNQSIYNGSISRFSRAIVVDSLHRYLIKVLPDVEFMKFPALVHITIRTVKNHGSISRRAGKVIWKPPKDDYQASWDEDNLTAIWTKVIRDALVMKGIFPDDSVEYITGGERRIEFVDDIEDRQIIIKIEEDVKSRENSRTT